MVISEMAEIERSLTEEKETSEDFNNKSSFQVQSRGTFWTGEAETFNSKNSKSSDE